MFYQVVSLLGAAMLLGAFLGNQRGWLRPEMRAYNALNFFGALLLTWVAVVDRRLGFIVLEGTWALIALSSLLRHPSQAAAGDTHRHGKR